MINKKLHKELLEFYFNIHDSAGIGTPTPFGYPANTPYTPSGQTPFMTPFATTPHQPQTPRYSGAPAPNAAPSAGASQGTFRTPAAPGAHRGKKKIIIILFIKKSSFKTPVFIGYGSQNHSSSPFNRQSSGSNRPSSQSMSELCFLDRFLRWQTFLFLRFIQRSFRFVGCSC